MGRLIMEHPSGLEDDGELANVSMEFWMHPDNSSIGVDPEVWSRLLAFQQGWKACKDFYKINI